MRSVINRFYDECLYLSSRSFMLIVSWSVTADWSAVCKYFWAQIITFNTQVSTGLRHRRAKHNWLIATSVSMSLFIHIVLFCNDFYAHIQQDWCQIRVRVHPNEDVLLLIQERVIWQSMLLSCTMSYSQVRWNSDAKMPSWKRNQTRPFQKEPPALFSAACPTAPTWPSGRCSATGSPARPLTKR